MTPWQVPTKSSCSPKSLRNVTNTRATLSAGSEDGFDQAVEVMRVSLLHDSDTPFVCRRSRLRPDRHCRNREPELRVGAGGRRRGKHDEVAAKRVLRPDPPGSVESDEVGAELVDDKTTSVRGACEENVPGRRRKFCQEAPLRRARRNETDLPAPGLGCCLPDCSHPPRFTFGAAAELPRTGDARQEQPVVGRE